MKKIRVLILEDDLETLEKLFSVLRKIENERKFSFAVTVLSDYIETDTYVNKNPQIKYDILLLDRDCFLGGSYHVINLDNFDKNKIISISSVPEYNADAQKLGVNKSILKEYSNLSKFCNKLKIELSNLIQQPF